MRASWAGFYIILVNESIIIVSELLCYLISIWHFPRKCVSPKYPNKQKCQILKETATKIFFWDGLLYSLIICMLISELSFNRMYSCVVQTFTMISMVGLHWNIENSPLNILFPCVYLHKICNFLKSIQVLSLFYSQKRP